MLALKEIQPGGHDSKDAGVLWNPERAIEMGPILEPPEGELAYQFTLGV